MGGEHVDCECVEAVGGDEAFAELSLGKEDGGKLGIAVIGKDGVFRC